MQLCIQPVYKYYTFNTIPTPSTYSSAILYTIYSTCASPTMHSTCLYMPYLQPDYISITLHTIPST